MICAKCKKAIPEQSLCKECAEALTSQRDELAKQVGGLQAEVRLIKTEFRTKTEGSEDAWRQGFDAFSDEVDAELDNLTEDEYDGPFQRILDAAAKHLKGL